MFCGTDSIPHNIPHIWFECGKYLRIFCGILLVLHNIVMDPNNVMTSSNPSFIVVVKGWKVNCDKIKLNIVSRYVVCGSLYCMDTFVDTIFSCGRLWKFAINIDTSLSFKIAQVEFIVLYIPPRFICHPRSNKWVIINSWNQIMIILKSYIIVHF